MRRRATDPGIYETDYGNAAVVLNGADTYAYDLDMGEVIPIESVTGKLLRSADSQDIAMAESEIESFIEFDFDRE